jgi:hypothetical protein
MRSMVEGDSSEFMPPPPPSQPSLRRLRKLACDGRFPSPLRGRIIGAMNR